MISNVNQQFQILIFKCYIETITVKISLYDLSCSNLLNTAVSKSKKYQYSDAIVSRQINNFQTAQQFQNPIPELFMSFKQDPQYIFPFRISTKMHQEFNFPTLERPKNSLLSMNMFIISAFKQKVYCADRLRSNQHQNRPYKYRQQKQRLQSIKMSQLENTTQKRSSTKQNKAWTGLEDRKMHLFLVLCYHRLYQEQEELNPTENYRKQGKNRLKFNFFHEMGKFVGGKTNTQCRTHYDRKIRDKKYDKNLETYLMKNCFCSFKIGLHRIQDLIPKLKEQVGVYLKELNGEMIHEFLLDQFENNMTNIHDKCLTSNVITKKEEWISTPSFQKSLSQKSNEKSETQAQLIYDDDIDNHIEDRCFDIEDIINQEYEHSFNL